MIGLGTLINTAGIIVGGILGFFFGKFLKERQQETLCCICGVATMFLGISGALEGMLTVEDGVISSGRTLLIILCLVLGAIIGEIINIDGLLERFGNYLKKKTKSENDKSFTEGFVNASMTVCIGAMAIIGSIEDGINHDISILLMKTILDVIIVFVMTGSMGKGCIFSAIPVFVLQGTFTIIGALLGPVLTDVALENLSIVGSILIFCVGVNLVWGKKIRVANVLPAIVVAVLLAYLPLVI